MNYEVNPFQDYESITIDELKDQANSLLNLVTEEQQPLRVCKMCIRDRSSCQVIFIGLLPVCFT